MAAPESRGAVPLTALQLDAIVLGLLLDAAGEALSGAAICDKLDLPRAQLLRRIESLRARGFHILAAPGRGYRLLPVPDELTSSLLEPLLGTEELGRNLSIQAELGSTNDEAHRQAEQGAAHGTVVLAERQTAGRGRRGRSWVLPPGKALAFSIVLRPSLPAIRAPELNLVAAVGVCEAARELGAERTCIKWPNDLEIEGRKLAGLLTELRAEGDGVRFAVLGIGLNVNVELGDLPPELQTLATSLRLARGAPLARPLVLARVLQRIEDRLAQHEAEGFGPLRDQFRELCSTLGRRVRAEGAQAGARLEGTAEDLAEDGALLVRTDAGELVRVVAGDVEHCRVLAPTPAV